MKPTRSPEIKRKKILSSLLKIRSEIKIFIEPKKKASVNITFEKDV